MKLVLYYFRCISNYRYRYRFRYHDHHDSFNHVPCNIPSMPSHAPCSHAQANRNVPIRATRPTASSRPSSSTTMRAIIWACSAGRASYRSRRTEITPRGRLSGQNVSPMANGRDRCPNVAATRRCSLSTVHKPTMPGWRMILKAWPGAAQVQSTHTNTHTHLKFLQIPIYYYATQNLYTILW